MKRQFLYFNLLLLICLSFPLTTTALKLVKISGDNQMGLVESTLDPFVVEVRDDDDDPVANERLQFEVIGGGKLKGGTSDGRVKNVTTGSDGRAEVTMTFIWSDAESVFTTVSFRDDDGDGVGFKALSTLISDENLRAVRDTYRRSGRYPDNRGASIYRVGSQGSAGHVHR